MNINLYGCMHATIPQVCMLLHSHIHTQKVMNNNDQALKIANNKRNT